MKVINRHALVTRHNPTIRSVEPLSPLAVGNGEFAFTADVTGLQSFPEAYRVPLGTQSQWGWHSAGGHRQYQPSDIRMTDFDTYGRMVGYPIEVKGQEEPFHWLRQNPHRLQLGQIGLRMFTKSGSAVTIDQLHNIEQTLNMWSGILTSRFKVEDVPVEVQTCCHPEADLLGVRIQSPLIADHRLEIAIGFPSSLPTSKEWREDVGLNWNDEQGHQTGFTLLSAQNGVFERTMDQDGYRVHASWSAGNIEQVKPHHFRLVPGGETVSLELALGFTPNGQKAALPTFQAIERASKEHWASFWSEGGAIELAASSDPRAFELERRIVLSQFLTAIHCAGSLPPQETGLLYSSWFGKFHLEMHWWHAVHFALWGRTSLLRKSLDWYRRTLPAARELAGSQGYEGARWPKMVGPEGNDSPSPIGPLLIWQQPHPIIYAELCYRANPSRETLDDFRDVVIETARFMASFAIWEAERSRYVLGPPVIPAQEEHKPEETLNPTFELEYWRHALELAQVWTERLGLPPESKWRHICDNLSALPEADGVYLAHEHCPDTFTRFNTDHPSMLAALGMLPGKSADPETMRRTLRKVIAYWRWDTAWGWDFPVVAMTAARLGERETAVQALLMDKVKNTYLPNGHNYQTESLTAYLPGNGGLLAAAALMAAGWQGAVDRQAPGFPDDGTWTVRSEGLNAWL